MRASHPMSLDPAERRAFPRRPFRAELTAECKGQSFHGNCQNLSEGGLCFMGSVDLAIGARLRLCLLLSKGNDVVELPVDGIVRWQLPPMARLGLFRYGVDFVDLGGDALALLADILRRDDESPNVT